MIKIYQTKKFNATTVQKNHSLLATVTAGWNHHTLTIFADDPQTAETHKFFDKINIFDQIVKTTTAKTINQDLTLIEVIKKTIIFQ